MKIGILTFHRACNYGAFLQCYALQTYLLSQGYFVEVIDYEPEYFKKRYAPVYWGDFTSLTCFRMIRRFVYNFVYSIPRYLRKRMFTKSINDYLKLSLKNIVTRNDFNFSIYDVVIVGSDQVWSPKCLSGFDKLYWGYFDCSGKKISYAASAGDNFSLFVGYYDFIKDALLNFDSISVREETLRYFLKSRFSISAKLVVDPTLLLTKEEWNEFAGLKKNNRPYLLLYIVKKSTQAPNIAKYIAHKLGINLIALKSFIPINPLRWNNIFCTPKDFVRLFRDATYIVTTSFHGTAFAIKFHKEFYAVNNGEPNLRIENLLESSNLKNRYISSIDEINLDVKTEYNENTPLEKLCVLSKEYISTNVNTF